MTDPIPEGFRTLTPHITVKGAAQAIEFYGNAFGASEQLRHEMGGMIMYAQMRIRDSVLMLNEEFPQQGAVSPPEQGGGVVLHLYVEDVDALFDRAVAAGATALMPVQDTFWGDRYGVLKDPFGHRWSIGKRIEDLTSEQIVERASKAFGPPS